MSLLLVWLLLAPDVNAGRSQAPDYLALWDVAIPFDKFLSSVRAREAQWKARFADAAVDADALTRVRALPERRRLLVVAEDRCSDSAWTVPYIAKLAAAVPERLELRVISREGASDVKEYRTPDDRIATPTVVILDELGRALGGWVERPSELQSWYLEHKASMSRQELYAELDKRYAEDAGKSTLREIVALLDKRAGGH